MTSCPSQTELEQYRAIRRADSPVAAHLANCAPCRERLREIEAEYELLAEISRYARVEVVASGLRASGAAGESVAFATDEHAPQSTGRLEDVPGYEIQRVIGRGGQAVVYEAWHTTTRRRVALKVMLYGPSDGLPRDGRFSREIRLIANLRHPGIVTLYDSGITADGRPFFTMEFIDGLPIHHWCREHSAAHSSINHTIDLVMHVCEAVRHAHQRGVIHRDLKPSNILVDAEGRPHILDFGLAKLSESSGSMEVTCTGQFLGTLAYAAPEQVRGDTYDVDTRTDVYALGAVLYELLTGRATVSIDGSFAQIVRRICDDDPQPPSSVRSGIDDELEMIVLKAIAKDPERRYENAGALLDDLHRYRVGEPISAKRDSAWYIARKVIARHRLPFAIGIGVIVLTVVLAITMSLLYGLATMREEQAREAMMRLADELDAAQIERGRLLALADHAPLAHGLIWQAHRRRHPDGVPYHAADDPIERQAYWALWQLYHRHPIIARIDLGSSGEVSPIGNDIIVKRFEEAVRPNIERLHHDERLEVIWTHAKDLGEADRYTLAVNRSTGRALAHIGDQCVEVDIASGIERGSFPLKDTSLRIVHIDPDAFARILHLFNHVVEIRSAKTGQLLGEHHSSAAGFGDLRFNDLVASIDGSRLFASIENRSDEAETALVFIWRDGELAQLLHVQDDNDAQRRHGPRTRLTGLCACDRGERIAAVLGDRVKLWQLDQATNRFVYVRQFTARQGWQERCAFSRDGRRIAVADVNRLIEVWDSDSGESLGVLGGPAGTVSSMAFSADAMRLYSTTGHDLLVHDLGAAAATAPSGSEVAQRVITVPGSSIHNARFGAGGILALGGLDETATTREKTVGVTQLWDVHCGEMLTNLPLDDAFVRSVAFTSDGSMLATAAENHNVYLWDVRDPRNPRHARTLVADAVLNDVRFSPDGSLVAAAADDGSVYVWYVESGARVHQLWHSAPDQNRDRRRLPSLAFNQNRSYLASVSTDGSVKVWNLTDGSSRILVEGGPVVRAVAWSPDGRQIAIGDDDWTLHIIDVETGHVRAHPRGLTHRVFALCYSPDGLTIAVATADGRISLWDPRTGRQLVLLENPDAMALSVDFSPDGDQLSASYTEGRVRIWNLRYFDAHIRGNSAATSAERIDNVHAVSVRP